jgi:hypothetical protein
LEKVHLVSHRLGRERFRLIGRFCFSPPTIFVDNSAIKLIQVANPPHSTEFLKVFQLATIFRNSIRTNFRGLALKEAVYRCVRLNWFKRLASGFNEILHFLG